MSGKLSDEERAVLAAYHKRKKDAQDSKAKTSADTTSTLVSIALILLAFATVAILNIIGVIK
jgi:hypothetical protein